MANNVAKRLNSLHVVSGLPRDSNAYPDGTDVVQVGIDHEFGSDKPRTYTSPRGNKVTVSGVPERSFMRSTFADKKGEWKNSLKRQLKNVIAGDISIEHALVRLGFEMDSDIKRKIVDLRTPPNSPQVIADKDSDNPLIDTGHLLESITHAVRKGKND